MTKRKTNPRAGIIRWMWKRSNGTWGNIAVRKKPTEHPYTNGRYVRVRITEVRAGKGKR